MRRRFFEEKEVRPPRDERVIVYCNEETKKRWQKAVIDMDVQNYEDALNKLLDLYELSSRYLGERRLDELIKKLNDILGVSVRMKIAPA